MTSTHAVEITLIGGPFSGQTRLVDKLFDLLLLPKKSGGSVYRRLEELDYVWNHDVDREDAELLRERSRPC